ncbi:MAG TPA: alpha/beta-type small acid-soluble spore protein [Bacillota bacterium]
MGTGQKRNTPLVLEAHNALDSFKYEIANELNIDTSKIQGGYWGYMMSRDTGAIGGNMVRRMIEAAERSLAEQTVADVKAGFQSGLSAAQSQLNQGVQSQFKMNNPGNYTS